MNANDLWSGSEYAYYKDRPRGSEAPRGARRVKVIRVFKQQLPGNSRMSAFAKVVFLDETPPYGWSSHFRQHEVYDVRARDIIDHWEDYLHTREDIEEEQRKRDEERRIALAEATAEREERERVKRESRERTIRAFLEYTHLPRDMVDFQYGQFLIRDTQKLRTEVLGLADE